MSDSSTSSGAALGPAEELPLWKAALTWCQSNLVRELLDANLAYCAARNIYPSENPFPTSRDRTWNRTIALVGGRSVAPSQRRDAAVAKVDVDLRQRVASRQVILLGLKVKPDVESSRTVLSEWWADHLAFDWEHSTVVVYGALYVGVTGRVIEPRASFPDNVGALAQPERVPPARRRPVGRTPYKPIIEGALAAYFDETGKSPESLAAAGENQSHLARVLETRLAKLHPEKVAVKGGLPKRETIRKHVRDILASALVDKGGR